MSLYFKLKINHIEILEKNFDPLINHGIYITMKIDKNIFTTKEIPF